MTFSHMPPPFLSLKASAESKGQIEGYASLFDVPDSDNDVVARGAFDDSLKIWEKSGRLPPLLWQHNPNEPIGVWTVLRPDSKGLFVRGQLFVKDVPQAAEAYALVKQGGLSGLSIGYQAQKARRDARRGVRILERIKLFEVSLVTFPALDSARVTEVKSRDSADAPSLDLLLGLRSLAETIRQSQA